MRPYLQPRHERTRPILVWCGCCSRYIAYEAAHTCELPPGYRARRDASRRQKWIELTVAPMSAPLPPGPCRRAHHRTR